MTPQLSSLLADAILLGHVVVIAFNVFGLIAIPLGAWRGWRFVRVVWWRALHVALLAVVALQALLDRLCFLTEWQNYFLQQAGETASSAPLIQRWVSSVIFWPLPLWFFTVLYVLIWIYVAALWWLVPPTSRMR